MVTSVTGGAKQRSYWVGMFFLLLVSITAIGAITGGLLFIIGNPLFGYNLPVSEAWMAGVKDGGFYALIWAPAIAFIRCVVLWHRSRSF